MDEVKVLSPTCNLLGPTFLFFSFHGILELRIRKNGEVAIDGPPQGSVTDRWAIH